VFDVPMNDLTPVNMSHCTQQCLHVFTYFSDRHVAYVVLSDHTQTFSVLATAALHHPVLTRFTNS